MGLTGGPNGIADIDPNDIFGYELVSRTQQYYFILVVVLLVLIGLHFLSESRTGRAWRALREDPLAAEAMSIPVNRLKLMAFAFGAGIAGLAGCIFAAVLTAVTSGNFALPILITIYAVVILGGIGWLTGRRPRRDRDQRLVPVPRAREPADERALLFYGLIALLLLLACVLGGGSAWCSPAWSRSGFAAHAVAGAIDSSWTAGAVIEGGRLAGVISDWVIIPRGRTTASPTPPTSRSSSWS